MWLFTKYGFYSVVRARRDANSVKLSKDVLMVRARRKGHLKALRRRFKALKGVKIHKDTHTDYRFRIFVAQSIWSKISAKLAEEIDYGNFKDTIKSEFDYADAAAQVWSVMWNLQERGRYEDDESSETYLLDHLFGGGYEADQS